MVMDTIQIRLEHKMVKKIDSFVKKGIYSSRADALRDAARRFFMKDELDRLVGMIPNTGDSVKEIRAIRRKLSKEPFDLDKINNL